MSTVVHFSPELGSWLTQRLDQGQPPIQLLETMVAERMDPRVAGAILDAFLSARRGAGPLPVDSLLLEDSALGASPPKPRIWAGARIATADRTVQVLARAENPTLALLGDLLSAEEAAHLIALARPRLRPSTVVDPKTGRDQVEAHRTSLGMFFRLRENAFIARLDRRTSEVMNLPVEHGEGFQVLHYPEGALNAPHFDYLVPSNDSNRASIARSGQRVSTLLIYLNDVEAGGETIFPNLGWSVAPKLGNGTYFEYENERGELDERSLHGSNPVVHGDKWVATKWMRERRFVSADAEGAEGMIRGS
jgi:prolyl 4-hydroxylase